MKKAFLICYLLFHCLNSLNAQISCREFFWAISHPVAAIKVKTIDRRCDVIFDTINKVRLDKYFSGGKLDAFRHVFYMAAFAQKVRVNKLRKLGIAHEKTNYTQFRKMKKENGEIPDSLSSVMDLKNNEIGFTIGSLNRTTDIHQLKEIVITAIKKGDAFIMKRNAAGKYVDCEGREITFSEKKWNVPKCLVQSH